MPVQIGQFALGNCRNGHCADDDCPFASAIPTLNVCHEFPNLNRLGKTFVLLSRNSSITSPIPRLYPFDDLVVLAKVDAFASPLTFVRRNAKSTTASVETEIIATARMIGKPSLCFTDRICGKAN